jgi:hypothetical protein
MNNQKNRMLSAENYSLKVKEPGENGASTEITCRVIKHPQYAKVNGKSAFFGLNVFGKF